MTFLHSAPNPFRRACLALLLGAGGALLQLACGGGRSVAPPPSISSFGPTKSPITQGTATTLTAVFTDGAATVDHGVGALASGVPVAVSPTADATYTLTVTNRDGVSKTATTAIAVVPAPIQPMIAVASYMTSGEAGQSASITAQPGVTYHWGITNGTVTAGVEGPVVTFTAGDPGAVTLTCVATNAAGTSVTGTATISSLARPSITNLAASPSSIPLGGTTTLAYTFVGGTGELDGGLGAVNSGGSTVVHPTETTTYTLSVTSLSGAVTYQALTVVVDPAPTVARFAAMPSAITVGQSTVLTFLFDGTGVIDHGVGTVSSGMQVPVAPTSSTTYTLTVTGASGATLKATASVTVQDYSSRWVYVANAGGGVSGFSLNEGTGALTAISGGPFDATTPALQVTSDPEGKFLLVVNGDGLSDLRNTISLFAINQSSGSLTKLSSTATGANPWAATVDPTGQFVYVRCAGALHTYGLEDGASPKLIPLAVVPTAAGTGEALVHPSGKLLFTVGRSSDSLQVFALDSDTGALVPNGSYSLPAGSGPLALALSNTGECLFTKTEGRTASDAQECLIHGFWVDVRTGELVPLADTYTGLMQSDSFHGVAGNPTQPVIYITVANSNNDFAGYSLDLTTGRLSALSGSTYDLFGGSGADSLVITRKGNWGLITDYAGGRIALNAVEPTTGILDNPVFYRVGQHPVSVTVVGRAQ